MEIERLARMNITGCAVATCFAKFPPVRLLCENNLAGDLSGVVAHELTGLGLLVVVVIQRKIDLKSISIRDKFRVRSFNVTLIEPQFTTVWIRRHIGSCYMHMLGEYRKARREFS